MSLPLFEALYSQADAVSEPVPVVAAGGDDPTVIEALKTASERGWVKPMLTGDIERIRQVASELNVDLGDFTLIPDEADSSFAAVKEIRAGRAKLLMKGQINTPALMKGILHKETGLRTGRTICQVVLMEIVRDRRAFLLSDTGVTISPTLDQKADILKSLLETARGLGSNRPRVAVMSATEKASEAMPDTLEAVELARRAATGEFGDCVVEGPLSFDLAYASDAGQKKKVAGEVTGASEAMLFPNLLAANLTVKGIMYTADCRFGGILSGAACPVVFMSRADTTPTRLNSLALALSLVR